MSSQDQWTWSDNFSIRDSKRKYLQIFRVAISQPLIKNSNTSITVTILCGHLVELVHHLRYFFHITFFQPLEWKFHKYKRVVISQSLLKNCEIYRHLFSFSGRPKKTDYLVTSIKKVGWISLFQNRLLGLYFTPVRRPPSSLIEESETAAC